MISKEEAKEELKKLVDQFRSASLNKEYISKFTEEDIKNQFIDPLLYDVLGWERQDIKKEQRILKGRADYILKIGNEEIAVIEAKRTNVPLNDEEGRQAVSYAYHRKIKFAILTNFKEIKVYHALSNIKQIDNNLLKFESGGYFRLSFEQFLDNFDKLLLLSKESFEKEEINKLLSKKDEKLSKSIDEHILNDLLKIRDWLSKELKSKKNYLSQEKIDEVVQVLIDRLIFIRSVEDRGLEPMNYLKSLEADVRQQNVKLQLFPYFLEEFKKFDEKYDSKLFERGILETEGAFSDEVLRKVILALYFGVEGNQERYLFDQIPGDLFGSIYEQYLGTILQSTEKRVTLKKESGKRKKMGIYYTPFYIVDYIVKNTVGEYIKDKSVDEILNVKIVDPACGSGSFLIRAFQEVCDVVEEKLKKGDKPKSVQFSYFKDRLDLGQKAAILQNCIYGVDLDEKAVELAQLNLLLKILEEETAVTRKRILPNMKDNIRNGNSLIDDSKIAGDKAFKWEAQFADVFRNGGFDVVIGNPPYIGFHGFKNEKEYYSTKYKSASGKYDIYLLFIEKSLELIKNGGLISYICPTGFMKRNHGENIRKVLLENSCIKDIIDFEHKKIFGDALNYTGIFTYSKPYKRNNFMEYKIDLQKEAIKYNQDELGIGLWVFRNQNYNSLVDKIRHGKDILFLSDFVDKISEGIVTGLNELYLLDEKFIKENKIELTFFKPCVRGSSIRRYYLEHLEEYIFYPYNSDDSLIKESEVKEKSPNYYDFLKKNISKIKSRGYFNKSSKKWYELWNQRSNSNFNNVKIIVPELASKNRFMLDSKNLYYGDTVCGFYLKNNQMINVMCLLGILNSSLLEWYYKKTTVPKANEFFIYKTMFLKQLPIKIPSKSQEKIIVSLVDQMLDLQKKYHKEGLTGNEKERLEQQIKNIDYEIDQEVYKLYELTKDEINIVEESLK